jgi:hypothetical protein
MYVDVSRDGVRTGYYREQKSTYDWDYATVPPVRKEKNPHRYAWIATAVEEQSGGGFSVTMTDILFLPPERTAPLPLNGRFVSPGYDLPLSPFLAGMTDEHSGADDGMRFTDADGDGGLSAGDSLFMNRSAEGKEFSFVYRDEPAFFIRTGGDRTECIADEDPEAVTIESIDYNILDDNTIDLRVDIRTKRELRRVEAKLIHPGEGGSFESGTHMRTRTGRHERHLHANIDFTREKKINGCRASSACFSPATAPTRLRAGMRTALAGKEGCNHEQDNRLLLTPLTRQLSLASAHARFFRRACEYAEKYCLTAVPTRSPLCRPVRAVPGQP